MHQRKTLESSSEAGYILELSKNQNNTLIGKATLTFVLIY